MERLVVSIGRTEPLGNRCLSIKGSRPQRIASRIPAKNSRNAESPCKMQGRHGLYGALGCSNDSRPSDLEATSKLDIGDMAATLFGITGNPTMCGFQPAFNTDPDGRGPKVKDQCPWPP